jgi:predicted Zn-dependent protease
MAESSLAIAEAGYSREQERDADDFGLDLVHAAYGTTVGALEFFEWIAENDGRNEQALAARGDSPPLTRDRIDHLSRRARARWSNDA